MAKYREKHITEASVYERGMEDGLDCTGCDQNTPDICSVCQICKPYLNTSTRKHYINPGDYIIMGATGIKRVCNPHVFALTYELVEA